MISSNDGEAFFQRAEVIFSLGEFCSQESLSFNDKVIFELSWEDYSEAVIIINEELVFN